jgi:hypothetical protein
MIVASMIEKVIAPRLATGGRAALLNYGRPTAGDGDNQAFIKYAASRVDPGLRLSRIWQSLLRWLDRRVQIPPFTPALFPQTGRGIKLPAYGCMSKAVSSAAVPA